MNEEFHDIEEKKDQQFDKDDDEIYNNQSYDSKKSPENEDDILFDLNDVRCNDTRTGVLFFVINEE